MTISVTHNSNGTITVTCGGESVTVGNSPAPDPAPQPVETSDIPILWPNDQHAASIIATGRARTEIISVHSVDDLPHVIRETHDLHANAKKPTIFQFRVHADKPLQIGNVSKVLSELGHPEWMGVQIKLIGPRDD